MWRIDKTMLNIHRAERADGLVNALGDLVQQPLDDPLTAEVVAVPTRGVERWLAQRLSTRLGSTPGRSDGVCANFDFPFPSRLVGGAVAIASGIEESDDPWRVERSVWALLEVVDQRLGEPWLATLAAHLGTAGPSVDPERRGCRFGSVRHIADLYDRYGVHRPEMLRAWAAGDDTDGDGRALGGDWSWQAELWRHLRSGIGLPSPAERLVDACDRLRADATLLPLPPRISIFGLTRLPVSYVEVLGALAAERDVHLFLLHPSPVLWEVVAAAATAGRNDRRVIRRAFDKTADLARNPLLASWGQDAREMQLVVAAAEGSSSDDHRPLEDNRATLLARIQADVRADRSPPGMPADSSEKHDDARLLIDPDDASLSVHSCHGLARQVEVVRDAILHALAEDPTLEARDVIVMCPDIETFAPLIHATFGGGNVDDGEADSNADGSASSVPGGAGPPDLRVRLADRSLRQTNPVLGVVSELLELASARLTAAQALDLAGREPVRRRFGLDDDDLARLEEWVADAGVRWGLDAAHRATFKLEWLEANTWKSGLDRLLVGVAAAEGGQRLIGGVLPLDDVGSGDIDLAGRFAEFIDRLHRAITDLAGARTIDGWAESIARAAGALTDAAGRDAWQTLALDSLLHEVVDEASVGGRVHACLLSLPEVRALLGDRLRGRPTRANFRTGHLTVCTLVPMRSVPHRMVCLLGLDDGVFPRKTARDGDDIILGDPHIGDRDARTEDRQLLLDAVLSATDRLVITYEGRDERTNALRRPAVPVGELLDVVDKTARTGAVDAEGCAVPARARVVVHHPLQPFDVRNFTPGALLRRRPWSFDPVALEGASALSGDRLGTPPFLTRPLPPAGEDVVELDQLVRFVQHPVKAFLRQRLGITLSDRSDDVADALPIDLNHLEQWGVGQRLLEALLAGADRQACVDAEIARGILPSGALADPVLNRVGPTVNAVAAEAQRLGDPSNGGHELGSVEVNLMLADGRHLIGTVAGVSGHLLRSVNYSRVGPKHRLAAWVRFLALTAAHPETPFEATTIGRRRAGVTRPGSVTVARLAPLAGDAAERRRVAISHLETLVDLYDRGMREPLPLYCDTSAAYVEAAGSRRVPQSAANKAWESTWDYDKEDKDLAHQMVLGGRRSLAEILETPPCQDEAGEGWANEEPTRFGRYARRLWDGLRSCEELIDT